MAYQPTLNPMPVSETDGADVTLGALADAAVGDASGSVNAHARQIAKLLAGTLTVTISGGLPNNTDATLLASASRTTTQTSANLTNLNKKGINVYINVTSIGTGNITGKINGIDPVSGAIYPILVGTPIAANGMFVMRVYPDVAASGNGTISDHLPLVFQIVITANNANAVVYSVGYTLLV